MFVCSIIEKICTESCKVFQNNLVHKFYGSSLAATKGFDVTHKIWLPNGLNFDLSKAFCVFVFITNDVFIDITEI